MEVYIITNNINGKVYIGQTTRTAAERFQGHLATVFKHKRDFKLSRALRKYGPENFKVQTLKICKDKEELNFYEKYFIEQYDSINKGYNMTIGGDGGDTYVAKTPEELNEIKRKISKSNSGAANGMARDIYIKNVKTNEVLKFETAGFATKYISDLTGEDYHKVFLQIRGNFKAISYGFGIQPLIAKLFIESHSPTEFSPYWFTEPAKGPGRYLYKGLYFGSSKSLAEYIGCSVNDLKSNKDVECLRKIK